MKILNYTIAEANNRNVRNGVQAWTNGGGRDGSVGGSIVCPRFWFLSSMERDKKIYIFLVANLI